MDLFVGHISFLPVPCFAHIGYVRPSVASQPKAGLLLTDLNSNERGDTHEGSVLMLGSSGQR